MFSDLKFIIFWWLTIFIISTLSLPLVFLIFKNFYDKGYIFAKIVSLSLLTYFIFIFGVLHILPFTNYSLVLLIILGTLGNIYYLSHSNNLKKFLINLKSYIKIFIFEEILFLSILIIWSFIRGFAPDIEGLEKFMDWGFVNSILRSQYMPPVDMWFSGASINYYYFGHLIFAVLTKLSSINSAITYNLSIATVCALTFVSGFSLSSNLVFHFLNKKNYLHTVIIAGLISALLLTFGGNLHSVYKIAKIDIENEGKLVLSKEAIAKATSTYWYPDATRFIGHDPDTQDKTIHEFPVYSFVVADLHGHMNDIPLVIFFMAFLFSLLIVINFSKRFILWGFTIPTGFILSLAYMTNAWDFAVYGLLFAIFFFLINLSSKNIIHTFYKTLLNGLLVILFWYLFSLPFSLNFTPMAQGLVLSDAHSPLYQLFILYGGFWLICLPFVIYLIYILIKNFKLKIKNCFKYSDLFVLSLIITATLLIIIPEIVYIKDIYINEYRRANTMFKLVYEAFIIYSLVAGYVLARLSYSLKSKYLVAAYKILFLIILMIHLFYPYFAIKSYYGLKDYKGLWGLNFLKTANPDNFAAINWINQNIKGQPVMLEAVGDSYTTFNQISIATGLPTVEGWIVHEWLWRNGYDKPATRQADVQKIYESENLDEVRQLLFKYNIKYIFVGDKEIEKYPKLNDDKFIKLNGKIIFESGKTKIYQI